MANVEGVITENIRYTIAPGLAAYDEMGSRVGEITSATRQTGYLTVRMALFSDKDRPLARTELYIPFRLITNIDPQELYLSMTTDELLRQFTQPPARTIVVEGAGESEMAVTSELSGYDGRPMVVERVSINDLRNRIVTGYHVNTSDYVALGTVKQYDSSTGWILVERSFPPSRRDLMVPVYLVARVDDVTREVRLVMSQADLQRMQVGPANVQFADVKIAEAG